MTILGELSPDAGLEVTLEEAKGLNRLLELLIPTSWSVDKPINCFLESNALMRTEVEAFSEFWNWLAEHCGHLLTCLLEGMLLEHHPYRSEDAGGLRERRQCFVLGGSMLERHGPAM
jgi:hypothetical protein